MATASELGRVEAPAGEVDLAGRAHALHEVGNEAERVTGDDTLLAACDELDQDLFACVWSDGSDESPHGHALAMDERLVAYPPSSEVAAWSWGYIGELYTLLPEQRR